MKKRTNFLIIPEFQVRVILYVIVMAIILICVYYFGFSYFFSELKSIAVELELPPEHPYLAFLVELKTYFHYFFWTASIICLFLFIIGGTYISHRIAGPLYKFQINLEKYINRENVDPISFRNGDFFLSLATQFNRLIKKEK